MTRLSSGHLTNDDGKAHFVRNRKTTLGSIIKYLFYDCGRTTAVEAINFY